MAPNLPGKSLLYNIPFYVILFFIIGCNNKNKETILGNGLGCDTLNTKFAAVIQPIILSNCTNCHGGVSASGGISLEGYDQIKANYPAVLSTMKSGTMPKGKPKLDDCTILKVETWINRGAQNN